MKSERIAPDPITNSMAELSKLEYEKRGRAFLLVVLLAACGIALSQTRDYKRPHRESPEDVMARYRVFDAEEFRKTYRITVGRFNKLLKKFKWQRKADGSGRLQTYPSIMILSALRQLASGNSSLMFAAKDYGISRQSMDLYLMRFCDRLIKLYSKEYLEFKWEEVVKTNEEVHGVPGMLGSLDCTHIKWNMCPAGYKGSYSGRKKRPTVILEAVVDAKLRFVHHFVGYPGACNDLNVLRGSPIMELIESDKYPKVSYKLGEEEFERPFIMVDGIYPKWSLFSSTVPHPTNERERLYKTFQEALRKDVERAFGILKKQWKILFHPVLKKRRSFFNKIVIACLILHNMNVEDNNYDFKQDDEEEFEAFEADHFLPPEDHDQDLRQEEVDLLVSNLQRRRNMVEIEDENEHWRLFRALSQVVLEKKKRKRKRK